MDEPKGRIYLIRHAQASFGNHDYDQLSELGFRQAEILGDYFGRLGIRFQAVFSGSLKRQIQTAETVISRMDGTAAVPSHEIAEEFNEFNSTEIVLNQMQSMLQEDPSLAGDVEKIHSDRRIFQKLLSRAMVRSLAGSGDGSSLVALAEFMQRVKEGIRKVAGLACGGQPIAIFTSGGTKAAVMQMALKLSVEETIRLGWQIANTSVSVFGFAEDRLTLSSFNSVAHLECRVDPRLITYL